MFGRHILTPTPSLVGSYSSRGYPGRVMEAGEGWGEVGNSTIMSLLMQLIVRCLDV